MSNNLLLWIARKISLKLKTVLDGTNIDTKGIRDQVIIVKTLAERLVSPTLFEVPGWKRIQFFPETFEIFGFDKETVSLTFDEVEHPISVANGQVYNAINQPLTKTYAKTFLVNHSNIESDL